MSPYVQKLLMRARRLNKIAKLTGKIEDILKHKLARKEATKARKEAKCAYRTNLVQNLGNNANQKTFWKVINNNLNRNCGSCFAIPPLIYNNLEFISDTEKADCLNLHFTSGIDIHKYYDVDAPTVDIICNDSISTIEINESCVLKELRALN